MKILIAIFTFILSFIVTMTTMVPAAIADSSAGEVVNPIIVHGLSSFRGKHITAFYSIGRMGTISNQRDQITLREIKFKTVMPIYGDSVTFSQSPILNWNGNIMPYNLIVFAIHNENDIRWINPDGTIPTGIDTGLASSPLFVDSMKRSAVLEQSKPETRTGFINFNFNLN